MKSIRQAIVCSLCCLLLSPAISRAQDYKMVWNFDSLDFKGTYNSFAKAPSTASIYICDTFYYGLGGRSLEMHACKENEGYCGLWMNIFDVQAAGPVRYTDLHNYGFLSLRIRGSKGGETFSLQLADKTLSLKEDSKPAKPLKTYLPQGITTGWQELLIPLKDFDGVNLQEAACITLNFTNNGCYEVFIDDICFKKDKSVSIPATHINNPKVNGRPLQNAIWVWETYKLFNNPTYRQQFINDCKQLHVQHAYMQLFYDDNLTALQYEDSLRVVVKACSQAGIHVYGLDGSPEWGLIEKHEIPMTIVQIVANYNNKVTAAEKLNGLHFDIEPYLLLGFSVPELRTDIVNENLFLKQHLAMLCKKNNLSFGVDIPFWYEDPDSNGMPSAYGAVNGKGQAMSYHMIDLCDQVCIMGYRNFAYGSDGMVSKDVDELRYASAFAGKHIWAGVETFSEEPAPVVVFNGIPKHKLQEFLKDNKAAIGRNYRFEGFRLVLLETDDHIHFGLEQPRHPNRSIRKKHKQARKDLTQLLEKYSDQESSTSLHNYLIENVQQWKIKKYNPWGSNKVKAHKAIYSPTDAKITFSGKMLADMLHELYEASTVFYDYPAFRGFAFHSYESLLKMKK